MVLVLAVSALRLQLHRCRPSHLIFSSSLLTRPSFATVVVAASRRTFSSECFLNRESSTYIDQMYEAWKNDPTSVHSSWNAYFNNVSNGVPNPFCLPHPITQSYGSRSVAGAGAVKSSSSQPVESTLTSQSAYDTSRIIQLVQGYQSRGHEFAKIDPLGLPHRPPFVSETRADARRIPIDYKAYGFTESDLDRQFSAHVPGVSGFLSMDNAPITLRQLVARLEETYCGSIGIEAMHIEDPNVLNYLRQVFETPKQFDFSAEIKRKILLRTAKAELFETFCGSKFSTSKRFGIDGCESSIIAVKAIAKQSALMGVNSIVIGMPHRGRLNMLINVLKKPMQQMMCEFQGITGFNGTEWGNTGDVKYHLGVDYDHFDEDAQRNIHMSVLANPSHLEAVDPLVLGQVRAQQYYSNDTDRSKVIPIVMHGDASFSGQGVVYETLQMSKLPNYRVGGTIHIIVNNQIGFTTNVIDQGSGRYPTDVAKCIDAPVFHVNADDPEACTHVALVALEYRQKFNTDVFINLVGYRRHGHNELDMPKFTQPNMYNHVSSHPSVLSIYSKKLINEGVVTAADVEQIRKETLAFYGEQYEASKTFSKTDLAFKYLPQWKHMAPPDRTCPPPPGLWRPNRNTH